jgi:hypothetical protein
VTTNLFKPTSPPNHSLSLQVRMTSLKSSLFLIKKYLKGIIEEVMNIFSHVLLKINENSKKGGHYKK